MADLRVLSLRRNNIGDEGVQALVSACTDGNLASLQVLALQHNRIGDVGMEALAAALAGGALRHLTVLDLDGNQISQHGIDALADALSSGNPTTLQKLIVSPKHQDHQKLSRACATRGIVVA